MLIKIFKFGGASVKDAAGIKNICTIIKHRLDGKTKLVVVVSAMGDTTDHLVELTNLVLAGDDPDQRNRREVQLKRIHTHHTAAAVDLFPKGHPVFATLNGMFGELSRRLMKPGAPAAFRDTVIAYGELLSTVLVNDYLSGQGVASARLDARELIVTDAHHGSANVNWPDTKRACAAVHNVLEKNAVIITQGFIGKSTNRETTTLGREGSDFSAAILACCVSAHSVTLWKDVPGLMNADPRILKSAVVLDELPYAEAAEMMYYGANLIHTKTISPLAESDIPLYVKSFIEPFETGTKIYHTSVARLPPMYVFKRNQVLLTCRARDFRFMSGNHLQEIFAVLDRLDVPHNLIQHSAITFSCCFDFDQQLLDRVAAQLSSTFEVHYNIDLTLVTVKNYTPQVAEKCRNLGTVFVEQCSRSTIQVLIKGEPELSHL